MSCSCCRITAPLPAWRPLATLPVFWALAGKRAIVAGGSDAAAWKAELLLACSAEVHVYAEELSDTFVEIINRGADAGEGRLFHHDSAWSPQVFEGAAIAIADCEDDASAADFFEAACTAGVPVNIIDKPRYCQFQFGSIVNRSPVVVAISTDGAAPILAQAIRRRIETLLAAIVEVLGSAGACFTLEGQCTAQPRCAAPCLLGKFCRSRPSARLRMLASRMIF